jgi:hypothetical protein
MACSRRTFQRSAIALALQILAQATPARAAGRPARYRKVENEPIHPGKRRDASGQWWELDEPALSFEHFGAIGDGVADDTRAVADTILCADRQGRPIRAAAGLYRLTDSIALTLSTSAFSLIGSSRTQTRFLLDHYKNGLILKGRPKGGTAFTMGRFTIGRREPNLYQCEIGHKTLYVADAERASIFEIEEYGAIGFGITIDRCRNYVISDCIVRDHFGGSIHTSGTDGIHIYRCVGPGRVVRNRVTNVGDDPISFGSVDANLPTRDFECYGNHVENTSGSIKVYGNASYAGIHDNIAVRCETGGVALWDDRNEGQSFDISHIEIYGNTMRDCGGAGAAGGVFLTQPAGNARQAIYDITIRNNRIIGCRYGITAVTAVATKSNRNVRILNNTIEDTRYTAIQVNGASGHTVISGNIVSGAGMDGILVYDPRENCHLTISDNKVTGYGARQSNAYRKINVRDRARFRAVKLQET